MLRFVRTYGVEGRPSKRAITAINARGGAVRPVVAPQPAADLAPRVEVLRLGVTGFDAVARVEEPAHVHQCRHVHVA